MERMGETKMASTVRFDMPDGKTLETHIRRLRVYLEECKRKNYLGDPGGFDCWARDVVSGALKNMSQSVFVESGD